MPTDKIIARYDKALDLVKELVPLCDVCHIYDNSMDRPYRIFKKRKEQLFYCSLKYLWSRKDISKLTGRNDVVVSALNKQR